jgi:hypothetical protein
LFGKMFDVAKEKLAKLMESFCTNMQAGTAWTFLRRKNSWTKLMTERKIAWNCNTHRGLAKFLSWSC